MDYPFENLDPERFQLFCQALLAREHPTVQCFPVAQPDGGRDALVYGRGDASREVIVYQVKFARRPFADPRPHEWLLETIGAELPKVKTLVANGATQYILMTNIAGTAHPDTGSIDKLHALLQDALPIPANCWWRDDISRRLDNAWDLKWLFPELMTGPDLIRAIIETGLSEHRDRRASAIRAFVTEQYARDAEVRFKQVDLQNRLLDLFVDVPALPPRTLPSRRQQALFHHVFSGIRQSVGRSMSDAELMLATEGAWHDEESAAGAATFFLHRLAQEHIPRVVVEGAPGQGKSTIT